MASQTRKTIIDSSTYSAVVFKNVSITKISNMKILLNGKKNIKKKKKSLHENLIILQRFEHLIELHSVG